MPISDVVVTPEQFPFGIFCSETDQANSDPAGDTMPAAFDVTIAAKGISIVDDKQIKVAKPGVYNFRFTLSLYCITASAIPFTFYVAKNGVAVQATRRRAVYPGSEADFYVVIDAQLEMAANDYVELNWICSDAEAALFSYPAADGLPSMPSTYAVVSMVSG